MYYQNYEDYMRSVLGYPVNSPNIYEDFEYRTTPNMIGYDSTYQNTNAMNLTEAEIRSLYPDIYHLVTPMINKACRANCEPITRDLIERMTDEIYMAIEEQTDVSENSRREIKNPLEASTSNKKVENRSERTSSRIESRNEGVSRKLESRSEGITQRLEKAASQKPENRSERTYKQEETSRSSLSSKEVKEERDVRENRQRNYLLRDLIKILILNQLLGGGRPNRPRPPCPPYPGGPGMPPNRPPIQPRDYMGYLKF